MENTATSFSLIALKFEIHRPEGNRNLMFHDYQVSASTNFVPMILIDLAVFIPEIKIRWF
jgi:hypothetical protein